MSLSTSTTVMIKPFARLVTSYTKPEPLNGYEQEKLDHYIYYSEEFYSLLASKSALLKTTEYTRFEILNSLNEDCPVLIEKTAEIKFYGLAGENTTNEKEKYSMYFFKWFNRFYSESHLERVLGLADIIIKEDALGELEDYERQIAELQ